ncbi:MAG: DUF1761 domain-containing protein [Planctomycetota bacterium]|jgi:hypothetical protein
MIVFNFGAINYWAVLVATMAAFVVGGLWYGVLFAKGWVRANAFTDEQVKAMASKQGRNFAIFLVAELIMAMVIALLVVNLPPTSPVSGLILGGLLWLGFAATIGAEKKAANNKSVAVWLIDTGHELVVLLVMGLIIGWWR